MKKEFVRIQNLNLEVVIVKVILSRKGFDSANGGILSPIMEDGTLISFPIPSNDKDTYDDLVYCGQSYSKILKDLKYKGNPNCHIDPDLSIDRRMHIIDNWCPVFGQINSSATYLMNKVGVNVGDLFLFFGNFHKIRCVDGTYQYVKKTGDFYSDNDLQIIWGYMQVGEIITDSEQQKKYHWHPHSIKDRTKEHSNVMFVASDKLSFNKNMPGAGVLKYRENRVLTAPNCPKATWIKRPIYDVDSIIGNRKNSSKIIDGLYYAGIWQELGLCETLKCEEWAKTIVL